MALTRLGTNSITGLPSGVVDSAALASGVGGSLVKLAETVATNSSAVDFDSTIITSTYKVYKFMLTNMRVDTDNTTIGIRLSTDGGSTFDSGSNYDRNIFSPAQGTTNDTVTSRYGTTSSMDLFAAQGQGNTSEEHSESEVTLFNPSSSSAWKLITCIGGFIDYSNNRRMAIAVNHYRQSSAVNGIRFYNTSGNNISGNIIVYGVAD